MKVEALMRRPVYCCAPSDTLTAAAQQMWDYDVGVLPVLEHGQLVGILTDRDIAMAALLTGRPLHMCLVSGSMSHNVHTCKVSDTIDVAEKRMVAGKVRRLPVLSEDGAVVGIVALQDLAAAMREAGDAGLTPGDVAKTLRAVSGTRQRLPVVGDREA